jgi:His/Glu/Gln/Arg/opine family amino acid ABC transporter permease subunit
MSFAAFLSIVTGAAVTALLSLSGIVIGVPFGLLLALIRWARVPVLNSIVIVFVSLIRSTPIVTLVLFVFFVLPTLGLEVDPVPAAIATLAINTSAFNCEIWRGALMDFPREQRDAARAAGMTRAMAFRRIVFPQVWRNGLPALVNEMTTLLKGTPAVAVIGIVEVTRAASRVGAATYEPLPPFLIATVLYTLVVLVFVQSQRGVERHMAVKYGYQT